MSARIDTARYRIKRLPQAILAGLLLLILGCAENPPAPVEDRSVHRIKKIEAAPSRPRVQTDAGAEVATYLVVKGDSLHSIAFNYGLDYRDLAQWNRIVPPYRIYVGQELRLSNGGDRSLPRTAPLMESTKPKVESLRAAPKMEASKASTKPEDANSDVPPSTNAEVVATQPETNNPPVRVAAATNNNGNIDWRWPGSGALISGFIAGDQTRQGIDLAGRAGDSVNAAAAGSVVYSGNGLLGYGELIIIKHNAKFLSAYGHNRRRLVQECETVKAGQPVAEMGASGASREMLHFEIRKNGKPVNPLDYLPSR